MKRARTLILLSGLVSMLLITSCQDYSDSHLPLSFSNWSGYDGIMQMYLTDMNSRSLTENSGLVGASRKDGKLDVISTYCGKYKFNVEDIYQIDDRYFLIKMRSEGTVPVGPKAAEMVSITNLVDMEKNRVMDVTAACGSSGDLRPALIAGNKLYTIMKSSWPNHPKAERGFGYVDLETGKIRTMVNQVENPGYFRVTKNGDILIQTDTGLKIFPSTGKRPILVDKNSPLSGGLFSSEGDTVYYLDKGEYSRITGTGIEKGNLPYDMSVYENGYRRIENSYYSESEGIIDMFSLDDGELVKEHYTGIPTIPDDAVLYGHHVLIPGDTDMMLMDVRDDVPEFKRIPAEGFAKTDITEGGIIFYYDNGKPTEFYSFDKGTFTVFTDQYVYFEKSLWRNR